MRKQYSKSEIKSFLEKHPYAQSFMTKKSNVAEEDNILKIDNKTAFINVEGDWLPHLKILLQHDSILPKVTVDMGAVKFVVKGADIMRPGVTQIEDFEKDAFIVIIDETHGKCLAVGKALLSSEEMKEQQSGKSIQNLYFVGDNYWNLANMKP